MFIWLISAIAKPNPNWSTSHFCQHFYCHTLKFVNRWVNWYPFIILVCFSMIVDISMSESGEAGLLSSWKTMLGNGRKIWKCILADQENSNLCVELIRVTAMINFLRQRGWARMPRYLIRHCYRCFCEAVFWMRLTFKINGLLIKQMGKKNK